MSDFKSSMLLRFRIETRKVKEPRIVVLRNVYHDDGKITADLLGSFNSRRSYEPIVAQLSARERYEFDNFVKSIEFSKFLFNTQADELGRFLIKASPSLKNSLFDIWQVAQEYGIEFLPDLIMLQSVLQKAKVMEQNLAILTKGKFQALTKHDIDITNLSASNPLLIHDKRLFNAIIENTQSFEEVAALFNDIAANKYAKKPKFKAHHFEHMKKQMDKGEKGSFLKWYYTVAIDILCKLKIPPESIIPPALLVKHWLRLNKQQNFNLTQTAFFKQFPHLKSNTICQNVLLTDYIDDDIKRMAGGHPYISPADAFNYWFEKKKKLINQLTFELVKKEFDTEFNLLADNPFFMTLIDEKINSK